jgi:chromosomal replication initiator protein
MSMTNQELWQAVLGELELSLSKANFTTWFKGTFIAENNEEKVVIGVPNTFSKSWLEKKYHRYISKSLQNITERQIRQIEYLVNPKIKEEPQKAKEQTTTQDATASYSTKTNIVNTGKVDKNGLNSKYTFDAFVVGKGNELAHAAAQSVAQKPGSNYNPLFIYGGVGLGKTHLVQAIGNEVAKKHPALKILYITCEKFTNDFIEAIRNGKAKKQQDTYRAVDILIVDDIQFIAGKEQTQEAFFHTFNELHQKNKQIVLSSDRPPKAIPALEKRLISRFEWGMMADINNPDIETRIAILEKKCAEKNFSLDKEMINYIVNNIQNNIRELEGALNRIIAYSQLRKKAITLEDVKGIVTTLAATPNKKPLTPKHIINTIATFYDISIEKLVGSSRKSELVFPRQITMYLMREELKSSYPHIGQELGGRDHTTAMHAYTKISRELENNEKIRNDIEMIKESLYRQN